MKKINLLAIALLLFSSIQFIGCKKDKDEAPAPAVLSLPVLSTNDVTYIKTSAATSGGSISSDGNDKIIARGLCYGPNANPSLADNYTVSGVVTNDFVNIIFGLTPSTTYHVRAYATNSVGTSYGNDLTFSTVATSSPVVSTTAITAITYFAGSGGGNVLDDGGSAVTARGICFGTSSNPTISNSITSNGTGYGSYTSSLSALTEGTTYYVRAYATNSVGTSYGNEVIFTTVAFTKPVVTTDTVKSITAATATSGGKIALDGGGAPITARGVCYGTSPSPDTSNFITTNGTGIGNFVSAISGLSLSTTYYVRAYATSSAGNGYGNEFSFTTPGVPVLSTTAITAITSTTATSGGDITSDGNSAVTVRGVCYGTSPNPTIANSITLDGTGTGLFVSNLSGLTTGTTYFVRSYATNGIGTAYGNEITFVTP